jgi:hypothetical protein
MGHGGQLAMWGLSLSLLWMRIGAFLGTSDGRPSRPLRPMGSHPGIDTVEVALGERSYPIFIGPGLLQKGDLLVNQISGKRVLIVTNEASCPIAPGVPPS